MEHLKDILKGLHEEFAWLIWGLVAIAILWALNGGLNEPSAHEGAYLKPPAPLDSGQVYGTYFAGTPGLPQQDQINLPTAPATFIERVEQFFKGLFEKRPATNTVVPVATSELAKKIYIDGVAGAKNSDPDQEYIRLIEDPRAGAPIQISGLQLSGTSFDGSLVIPQGVQTLVSGSDTAPSDIVLNPGDRAIITSSVSPVGVSFKVNTCSGYLAEGATYVPALSQTCADGSSCKTNTAKGYTYNACVAAHQTDKNFYTNEWRIYMGQNTELWQQPSDTITLSDANGQVIDSLAY